MNKKANTKLPLCEGSRKGLGHTLGPKKKKPYDWQQQCKIFKELELLKQSVI